MLRKLVEADPAALTGKTSRGKTPFDLARENTAAPECVGYLSGENWKLFAAEGAVEAEVVEPLRADAGPLFPTAFCVGRPGWQVVSCKAR